MDTSLAPAHMLDILEWYIAMGVEECVEEAPQAGDAWRLASGAKIESASRSPVASSQSEAIGSLASTPNPESLIPNPSSRTTHHAPRTTLSSVAESIAEARTLADNAANLAALEEVVRGFNGCSLKKTATNTVFAQGVAASRVMFVGEAPGAEEDRQGVPFCGASGQLLDKMLSFIDLRRAENFYITNCLFWRPPGNRQPSPDELEICRPFVEKHIALVNPRVLVLVGGTATSAILKDTRGITRLRGQIFSYRNDYMSAPVPVHVIYHPSYLLRQPMAKKQAWVDVLKLRAALAQ